MSGSSLFRTVAHCFRTIVPVVIDLIRLAFLAVHSRRALAAENLFLRKQLALFQERQVKPRRANDSTRWMMATLSRMFPEWKATSKGSRSDSYPGAPRSLPSKKNLWKRGRGGAHTSTVRQGANRRAYPPGAEPVDR